MKKIGILFLIAFVSSPVFAQLPFEKEIYKDSDISYNNCFQYGTKWENILCFYVPKNTNAKPLLVIVPGSGFLSGNGAAGVASQFVSEAMSFAKRGYAVVVVNYQRQADPCPGFRNVVGEAAADVNAAIQFTLAFSSLYNINPNCIFIYGQSAGGIAATATTWLSYPRFQQKFGFAKNKNSLPQYNAIGYTIRGMALESSGILDMDIFSQSDNNTTIPLLLMQSIGDVSVPFNSGISINCSGYSQATIYGTNSIVQSIQTSPVGNPRRNISYAQYIYYSTAHNIRDIGTPSSSAKTLETIAASLFAKMLAQSSWASMIIPITSRIGEEENIDALQKMNETEEIIFADDQLIFHLQTSGNFTLRLYDAAGTLKKEAEVNSASPLSTHDLVVGMYIAILETEHGTVKKKIIVQR